MPRSTRRSSPALPVFDALMRDLFDQPPMPAATPEPEPMPEGVDPDGLCHHSRADANNVCLACQRPGITARTPASPRWWYDGAE